MRAISAAVVFLASVGLFASSKVGGSHYQGFIVTVACVVAVISLGAWIISFIDDKR